MLSNRAELDLGVVIKALGNRQRGKLFLIKDTYAFADCP